MQFYSFDISFYDGKKLEFRVSSFPSKTPGVSVALPQIMGANPKGHEK
jgi:hypothetical protein